VFSKNREWLLKREVAEAFFEQVLKLARQKDLLSDEHFTVDGTLIEAWRDREFSEERGRFDSACR
jgi:transposase